MNICNSTINVLSVSMTWFIDCIFESKAIIPLKNATWIACTIVLGNNNKYSPDQLYI